MRTSDANWEKKIQEKGQFLKPQFLNVKAKSGRSIHGIALHSLDSLPLVVMVHGSPGASDAFLDYFCDTNFTKKARLLSIDRPGFGFTAGFGTPEPDLQVQAEAVEALVNQLAPNQKVILVGHSLGGPVIVRFAMDYPERTAGLVVVAGSVDPAQEQHPWWQTVVDWPPVKWLIPKPLWTSNAEIIPLEIELKKMLPLWPHITCPVRIVHAVDDSLVPIANAAFAQKMLVNCSDLKQEILPSGDHFILWTRMDKVKAAIESLFNQ